MSYELPFSSVMPFRTGCSEGRQAAVSRFWLIRNSMTTRLEEDEGNDSKAS